MIIAKEKYCNETLKKINESKIYRPENSEKL